MLINKLLFMSIYFIFIFLMAFLYDAYLIKKTCPPKIWLLCLYWSIVILLIGTRDVVIDTINPKYLITFSNILRVLLLIIIPFYSFVCAKRYFCKRKLLIPVIILIPYIHYFIYEILYYLIYNYYY